tara:strand:- start:19228 stop:20763 length:1536 start_codon:yes stop_codon:yes gene_type:complete
MANPNKAPHVGIPVPVEIKQLDEDGTFIALGSVFGNVDFHGDIVDRGAFENSIAKSGGETVILWQHDPSTPIGKATISETFDGLMVHGRLTLGASKARDALALMRDGVTTGFSIGYDVVDFEVGSDGIRHLKELRLWEVSVVTFPANDAARLLQVKGILPYADLALADRTEGFDPATAKDAIKSWSNASAGPNDDYLKGFVWQDDAQPEVFSSARFPIATVVNDRLVAVPDAIEAAAKHVNSLKDDELDSTARDQIKGHLNQYYRKMRVAFGDDTIRAPWEGQASMEKPKAMSFDRMLARMVSEAALKRMDVKTSAAEGGDLAVSDSDLIRLKSVLESLEALIGSVEVAKAAAAAKESAIEGESDEAKESEEVTPVAAAEDEVAPALDVADADADTEEKDSTEGIKGEAEDEVAALEEGGTEAGDKASEGSEEDASDAPSPEQGEEDEKSFVYDGAPVKLGAEAVKALGDWAGGAVKVTDGRSKMENSEVGADLLVEMLAFAGTLNGADNG